MKYTILPLIYVTLFLYGVCIGSGNKFAFLLIILYMVLIYIFGDNYKIVRKPKYKNK